MSEYASDWVERTFKLNLSSFQKEAINLLCRSQSCGPYDFSRTFENADWNYGKGVRFVLEPLRFATFDFNGLTELVIGAHEKCIRVDIEAVNFRNIAIIMHPRSRVGDIMTRHPTIEEAIEIYRKCDHPSP